MSTVILESKVESSGAPRRLRAPEWLREPLLHFVLLGGLLFAVDHFLAAREADPHTIIVDAQIDAHAIDVFKQARGHEPSEDELYALRRVWLDNEVLYREGLALGLDQGDATIRDRVIFKTLSMIEAGVKLPPVTEATLREWFEKNRAKYDEPARFDFQEAVLAGEKSEARMRAFAAELNAGAPGQADADLRVFSGRPQENLEQGYGADFAKALENSPPGEWRALSSTQGFRVVRLGKVTPPKPANFDELGSVIVQDWTDAVMADQRSAAVRTLAKKYKVKVENGARVESAAAQPVSATE